MVDEKKLERDGDKIFEPEPGPPTAKKPAPPPQDESQLVRSILSEDEDEMPLSARKKTKEKPTAGPPSHSTHLFLNKKCIDKLCTTNVRHEVAYDRIKAE